MTAVLPGNSAIPAGLRKPPAAFDAEPKGHAAGILFVAPDGDVLVLRRSSAEANFSGHWALPGGGVDAGETPEQGALREAREEMGVDAAGGMKLLDRRMTPTGMGFTTFAFPTKTKFAPKLNDEHSGYAWAPLDQLPQPLHPAVATTLRERIGVGAAADMKPEDWYGLRNGFLKWTLEEEREPSHDADEIKNQDFKVRDDLAAQDSALLIALDRDSVRERDRDGRMRIGVANICKAMVSPYKGSEIPDWQKLGLDPNKIYQLLRDPEEVERATPTFNGVQILRKHKPVSANDAQLWDVVGCTGSTAEYHEPYIRNSLSFWTQEAIDGIESDIKKELSPAYHYRADMTPGNFRGSRYDGVMRDIVGNHVALVEDGRQGPDVIVGDSNQEIEQAMKTTVQAIANRTVSFAALAAYLRPKLATGLAMDSAINLTTAFKGVTGKSFPSKIPAIAASIRSQTTGKLAQDASLNDVEKVLGMLEKHEVTSADAEVPDEQSAALESAASAMPVMEAPKAKDGSEGLAGFLKEKGMGEDDIKAACDFMRQAATDESPEEKEKREKEEAAKKAANDADPDKDKDKKDMVTKPAMDAAINAASEATAKRVREEQRAMFTALSDVRPYVGELSMAFDSADEVYRHSLGMLGVKDAKTIHASALKTILGMQPKAGAKPNHVREHMAMDAATIDEAVKLAPGLANIKIGV